MKSVQVPPCRRKYAKAAAVVVGRYLVDKAAWLVDAANASAQVTRWCGARAENEEEEEEEEEVPRTVMWGGLLHGDDYERLSRQQHPARDTLIHIRTRRLWTLNLLLKKLPRTSF